MKKKIIKIISTFSLIIVSNHVIAKDYYMHIPLEKDQIIIGNENENSQEGNNGVGQEPGETCSNSFAYVGKESFDITYSAGMIVFTLKNTTGYDSYTSMIGKSFVKLLVVTELQGISSHTAGALLVEGTPLQYTVRSGESIKMTITPKSYNMETFEECASGIPVEVINATYDQITNLPSN
jgi:hypothetical protein